MRVLLALCYGALCYAVFFLTFLYAIAFVGDFLVPRTLDRPPPIGPQTLTPWIIDLTLLGVFAAQHSGSAAEA